jgi:hypothetical protein
VKKRRFFELLVLLAGMLFLSSCSYRGLIVSEFTDLFENGVRHAESEANLHLLSQSLPSQIQLLETLALEKPKSVRIPVLLSRLYAAYAFVALETELEREIWAAGSGDNCFSTDRQRRRIGSYYQKGLYWANRALEMRRPGFQKAVNRVDRVDGFLAKMAPDDVSALFWYGFNLAGYIQQNRSDIVLVAKAYLVEKCMSRVLELEPGYYHGTAHLVMMAYHAAKADMPGGGGDESAIHYRALQEMHGGRFLLNDLIHAYGYERPRGDRAAFQKSMERILSATDLPAELQMLNAVAIERASIYTGAIDLLFDNEPESVNPQGTTP